MTDDNGVFPSFVFDPSSRNLAMPDYLLQPRVTLKHRFAFIGIPYDSATTLGNPGARFGPAALREQLGAYFSKRLTEGKLVDLDRGEIVDLSAVEVADYGDLALSYYDMEKCLTQITGAVHDALEAGYVPLIVGGDHEITYPCFRALHNSTGGALGLVQLDAHCDMLDFSERQGRLSGSSPMVRSLELGRLAGKNFAQVGVRGYATTQQWGVGEQYGVHRILASQFAKMGAVAAAEQALAWARADTEKIYLTIDLDVLNPGEAPGTGWPEPGGLMVQELIDFVRVVAPHVDAIDIAELNPLYDSAAKQTAVMAARVLLDCVTAKAGA
jgi:agmatinase